MIKILKKIENIRNLKIMWSVEDMFPYYHITSNSKLRKHIVKDI